MRIGIAALVMIGIGIVLSGIFFFGNSPAANGPANVATPDSVEFDFILDIIPENGTVLQGTSSNINVSISYLQGNYENIALEASGIPADADYVFSQSQGFPTNGTTFNSILTVYASEAVPTDSYLITIKATSQNGKSYSRPYSLFVLDSGIRISGSIDGGIDVIPTEIVFRVVENTGEITHRFTAMVEEGYYELFLPNNKFYYVAVRWEKIDGSSGIYHFIQPFGVNRVGVTSINCPFSFNLLHHSD